MKLLKLLSIFLLFTSAVCAQNLRKAISDFQVKTKSSVTINDVYGVPEFIVFANNAALKLEGSTLNVKAFNFLESNKNVYAINDVNASFVSSKTEQDNYGLYRVVLQQRYNGVPVYDGKLLFHFNSKKDLTAINGNYIPNIKLNAVPGLSKRDANDIALQEIENQGINYSGASLFVHDSKLYVFNKGLARGIASTNDLVYEVEVRNNSDVREFLFVNAHTGVVVEQYTGMAHVLDRIVYEGDAISSNIVWQEGEAFPSTLTIWQQNEVIASGHTYNFFKNAFGYTSYDGADAQMRTVNNDPNISCPNANWNGSTANYCDGTAADDVIAHEWGHAYTQFTSNLIYMWQSGAINESYSDIWGETIDLLNNYEDTGEDNSVRTTSNCEPSDRWKIAEDATAFGSNLRDMWNPPCKGDPGKVTDGQYLCGTADSGGVHINSGIPNHAYALLVDGGSYNGQVIVGIGFTKAAHIFWRAQSQYLTATSDFNNLADALEASANDLIGVNLEGLSTEATPAGSSGEIITSTDIIQLNNAILAVELRINPDACGYEPILGPAPDLCDAANNNPIFFEDWENGLGTWLLDQVIGMNATWTPRDWQIETSLPDGRPGSAIYAINAPIGDLYGGDCATDFQNGILRLESPIITMPNVTEGSYELAFDHYVFTEANWDGGNLKISINGGAYAIIPMAAFTVNPYNGIINSQAVDNNDNPMESQIAYTGSDEGSNKGSWGKSIIDLSSLGVTANNTIQIRFDFGTDGCNGRKGWYVDEFVVYNCAYSLSNKQFNAIDRLVTVYPNPSNGVFNLKKIGHVDLLTAEIHDINGRFITSVDLSLMTSDRVIDLSQVASGLYFMTVTSEQAQGVIKLLKQ